MKVIVLTGSPHKNGTTALLADKFVLGAKEAGHQVVRFDAAFEKVKPCMACEYCVDHGGMCIHADAGNSLMDELEAAEYVVFVTPLYYYGMSAQLKAVVDRFHGNNGRFAGNKKAMLLAAAYGSENWTMDGLNIMYESILRFLSWDNVGTLYALGCPTREILEQSHYLNQAYELGNGIKEN